MDRKAKIEEALALLQEADSEPANPPAIVVLSPERRTSDYIVGNEGGFIRLAIASLNAAGGEDQSFKNQDWVTEEDLDWILRGLKYDSHAHYSLPQKETKFQRTRGNILALLLLFFFVSCFVVGIITILHWIW